MKRKLYEIWILILMTAVLSALAVSGGNTDSSGSPAAGEDGGARKLRLKWAVWEKSTTSYWKEVADAYTVKHPEISIELVDINSADFMTALATELSGGRADLDIVTIKDMPGYAALVSKGLLEPLNERIRKDGVELDLYSGAAEQAMADGLLYELPFRSDFWVLFYNKDIFDAAGIPYPSNDMTIEEYDNLARSVTDSGTDRRIYGAHYHSWRSAVQLFGILDGKHSVLDGSYDFLKPYYEMVLKQEADGVCRSYVDINAVTLHYSAAFTKGNTATMNMGSWYIPTLIAGLAGGEYDASCCGNWGIVKYPHPKEAEEGTTLGTVTGLSIPAESDKKDAAWDFIRFASGEEGAEILAGSGQFPAIMNNTVVDRIASMDGFPDDAASREALKTSRIYLEAPYGEKVSEIDKILESCHKDIMTGNAGVDEGILRMNEEMSAILAE